MTTGANKLSATSPAIIAMAQLARLATVSTAI